MRPCISFLFYQRLSRLVFITRHQRSFFFCVANLRRRDKDVSAQVTSRVFFVRSFFVSRRICLLFFVGSRSRRAWKPQNGIRVFLRLLSIYGKGSNYSSLFKRGFYFGQLLSQRRRRVRVHFLSITRGGVFTCLHPRGLVRYLTNLRNRRYFVVYSFVFGPGAVRGVMRYSFLLRATLNILQSSYVSYFIGS